MADGKDTFSKFRACCNATSNVKNEETGLMIHYTGIEDRWLNDPDYKLREAVVRDVPDQRAAMHRDVQAALFFGQSHGPL